MLLGKELLRTINPNILSYTVKLRGLYDFFSPKRGTFELEFFDQVGLKGLVTKIFFSDILIPK